MFAAEEQVLKHSSFGFDIAEQSRNDALWRTVLQHVHSEGVPESTRMCIFDFGSSEDRPKPMHTPQVGNRDEFRRAIPEEIIPRSWFERSKRTGRYAGKFDYNWSAGLLFSLRGLFYPA
jgi:hypothetical protein